MADPWPMRLKFLSVSVTLVSLLLLLGGCTTLVDFFRPPVLTKEGPGS